MKRACVLGVGVLIVTACVTPSDDRTAELSERLLAADSATLTLEQWCTDHQIATPAKVYVEKLADPLPTLSDEQRALLQIGPEESVGYRHVRLKCGEVVLSDAQNWFVPSRLTAEMREMLANSDTPYGRVILPLQPIRDNSMIAVDAADPPETLFKHRGLVSSAVGLPLALVEERYQAGILSGKR